jgi:hypothetical protein
LLNTTTLSPITTNDVSLNHARGEVNLIQRYVIKFVSDLWQVSGFPGALQFLPSAVKHHKNSNS